MGTAAGTFYYTYGDHLGNVVALSNTTGGYLANSLARYDPFGNYRTEPAATVNPGQTNHGFTGHRHNNTGTYATQDVGLIYMNARYYLPEVGRFISPDTIVPDPGNPQSYNRYSYVRNNPLNFTDPTGHKECESHCPGDSQDWRSNTLAAWEGTYDIQAQQENSESAAQALSMLNDLAPGSGDLKGLIEVTIFALLTRRRAR